MKPARISILVALSLAIPAAALAQASDTGMASAPANTHKTHKQLKHHGKGAAKQEAASAAGTSDKGMQN